MPKKYVVKILIFLYFCLMPYSSWAIKTNVILLSGEPDHLRQKAATILTHVLNSCNKHYEIQSSLEDIENYFTTSAFHDFFELVKETELYAVESKYETYLIKNENSFYEVRDIKVHVTMGNTRGLPFQYLVFVFNQNGVIVNVHFAIEKHHYKEIIQQGKQLEDLAFREKILHFIELYRTAYCKKDIDFITKTLSEDALIIVGYVIKTKKQTDEYLNKSFLGDEKIEFIKLGKHEYLERLKNVFRHNDFVKVQFDEINIERHHKLSRVYGVQLKQRWNSSRYSDEGYLFLMVDFITMEEPIIHVRAWQPNKFDDGSTISIYDFNIIE